MVGVAGAGALSCPMNPDDLERQDGGAVFDALAAAEGPIDREQPTGEQEREPFSDEAEPATPDAEVGRTYAEAAEEMKANPLFDLDPNHGLPPSTEENW